MPRRSKEEAEKTRAALVDAAARLIRKRGMGAVSVAEVMAELDMTVGGFYKHFESKEALVSEAIEQASKETAEQLRSAGDATLGSDRLGAVLDHYLSAAHRRHPEHGCPVAALAIEAAQGGGAPRKQLECALHRLIEIVEQAGTESVASRSKREKTRRSRNGTSAARSRALHAVAASVGAVVLARAIEDKDLEEALVAAVREELMK